MRKLTGFLLILFLVGLVSPSAFGTDLFWEQVTDSAPWGVRQGHTSVVFDGKMWAIGGGGQSNQVWSSEDGAAWTLVNGSAPWVTREEHTSVVFDGKIWVIGGAHYEAGLEVLNDVWYSTDGVSWFEATASAPWQSRYRHTSVVFDNKMWVIGGEHADYTGFENLNDVWYSTNGTQWYRSTASAPWAGRVDHASVVYDGKMWVILGGIDNWYSFDPLYDVWYSTNGTNWVQSTASAEPRLSHSAAVYEGEMWVLGNSVVSSGLTYRVSSSLDGTTWIGSGDSPPGVPWSSRSEHTSVVYDGKLWVIGGIPGEVWCGSLSASPVTGVNRWEDHYR